MVTSPHNIHSLIRGHFSQDWINKENKKNYKDRWRWIEYHYFSTLFLFLFSTDFPLLVRYLSSQGNPRKRWISENNWNQAIFKEFEYTSTYLYHVLCICFCFDKLWSSSITIPWLDPELVCNMLSNRHESPSHWNTVDSQEDLGRVITHHSMLRMID